MYLSKSILYVHNNYPPAFIYFFIDYPPAFIQKRKDPVVSRHLCCSAPALCLPHLSPALGAPCVSPRAPACRWAPAFIFTLCPHSARARAPVGCATLTLILISTIPCASRCSSKRVITSQIVHGALGETGGLGRTLRKSSCYFISSPMSNRVLPPPPTPRGSSSSLHHRFLVPFSTRDTLTLRVTDASRDLWRGRGGEGGNIQFGRCRAKSPVVFPPTSPFLIPPLSDTLPI